MADGPVGLTINSRDFEPGDIITITNDQAAETLQIAVRADQPWQLRKVKERECGST